MNPEYYQSYAENQQGPYSTDQSYYQYQTIAPNPMSFNDIEQFAYEDSQNFGYLTSPSYLPQQYYNSEPLSQYQPMLYDQLVESVCSESTISAASPAPSIWDEPPTTSPAAFVNEIDFQNLRSASVWAEPPTPAPFEEYAPTAIDSYPQSVVAKPQLWQPQLTFNHIVAVPLISSSSTDSIQRNTPDSVASTEAPPMVEGKLKYYCKTCRKYYISKKHMERHVTTKTHLLAVERNRKLSACTGNTVACLQCGKTFRKNCYLLQHLNFHHSQDRSYKCLYCGKHFKTEEQLQIHIAKHESTDKPFKCNLCTKQFHHRIDLRRHMDKHNGTNMKTCPTCHKAFNRHDHLWNHIRTHLDSYGINNL